MTRVLPILLFLAPLALVGCSKTHETQSHAVPEAVIPQVDHERAGRLNVELAMAYMEQGNMQRAKEKLNRAERLAPSSSLTHYARGFYLERIGETEDAESAYQKAISLHKGGDEYNNYGAFLCRQGRFDAAEEAFLAALEDKTYAQTAETLENLGLCTLQSGAKDKATAYFERALRQDRKRANAALELGFIRFEAADYLAAQHYFNVFQAVSPYTARALQLGVELARHFDDSDTETRYLLLLKDKFPRSPAAKLLLAEPEDA